MIFIFSFAPFSNISIITHIQDKFLIIDYKFCHNTERDKYAIITSYQSNKKKGDRKQTRRPMIRQTSQSVLPLYNLFYIYIIYVYMLLYLTNFSFQT